MDRSVFVGSIHWDSTRKLQPSERCGKAVSLTPTRSLKSYQRYYNEARTHLSLSKDAPVSRGVQAVGRILCQPILGGLHHQYVRI
jgi:hypothetical protein